jgi:hypothetical protein
MEGYWFGGKWCPPELYYYINFHTITFESGTNFSLGRPWLRDIDWEKAYIYTEACGFSGFELDTEYTCNRKYGPEKDKALRYKKITEEELKTKKYINVRDYLKRSTKNLGKPLYENEPRNIIDLESRGGGKTFWATGCATHNFLFDGARDYDKYLLNRKNNTPLKSETLVGAINTTYSNNLLDKIKIAIEYLPGKAIINSGDEPEFFPSPLWVSYTGSVMPGRNYTSDISKSLLHHRTFQDNPLAAAGLRPNRVFLDEVGFIDNLLETWQALLSSEAVMATKRMVIHGMGTGGLTAGGAALYAQEIFYNPEAYGCLIFDDVWENKGKIGYFLPATKALNEFKFTDNYISDENLGLQSILEEREEAKKATSRTKLQATIINKPIKPSEIFLRMEGNLFPIIDLNSRLATLETEKTILNSTYKVQFSMLDGKPQFGISTKEPIREFPLRRGFSMDACVEIFELPKKDANGNVFSNRYIAGWDPIDTDDNKDVTQSLQSIFVLDSWTNRLVAEYTARTYLVEEYYEQARRLFIYYNAICNYENKIKGPYAYFKNKNSLYLLAETPEILKDQNIVKGGTVGNKSLGTATNDHVISYGLGLILSYLDEQAYDKEEGVKNIEQIDSPGLLKELISYSGDINVDRIMALIMVLILKADRLRITEVLLNKKIQTKTQDKFWDKPFKGNKTNLYFPNSK